MAASGYLTAARRKFVVQAWVSAALIALAGLYLAPGRAVERLESGTYDARVRWSADLSQADPRIVIIDIDNASFYQLKDVFGRWPWPRRVYTGTLRHVSAGKPRAFAFDVVFEGASEDEAVDARLAEVIRESGNVVLAFAFAENKMTFADPEQAAAPWKALEPEAVAVPAGSPGEVVSITKHAVSLPTEKLAAAAAGMGAITATFDPDSTNRRVPLQFVAGGKGYRSFALRVADLVNGATPTGDRFAGGEFRVSAEQRVPVDKDGRMLILWHGGREAYKRIPLWEVLCSIQPEQCDGKVRYPPEFFRDRIVLMGASAASAYDIRATPFDKETPGFVGHAAALDNLLRGEAVRLAPFWALPLAVVLLAAVGASVPIGIQSTGVGTAAVLALLGLYATGAVYAFERQHLWVPMVAPMGAGLLAYISAGAIRFVTTGRELRRTRGTLDRYIAPQLVDYVLENLESVELGGQRKELTILFSDIRGFTTMTEGTEPQELIELLNEYLKEMTEIIFHHEGIVDKFIGDGILAYWGAFTPGKNHALLASRAALEMLEKVSELNRKWAAEGRRSIAIGIGVNTGQVIFGNVGTGKKVEFTVIGDPVNLAARLEGLNKDFGTSVIISEFTHQALGELAEVRSLGGVKVKGKTIETQVFELRSLRVEGGPASAAESLTVPDKHTLH